MLRATCLIWEIPLGCVSRLVFLVTRTLLRRIVSVKLRRTHHAATEWQMLDAQLLQQRFALPVVLTEGPRWNTHAVIGRVGPLDLNDSLAIQAATADRSARAWTIVVYTFPGHRAVSVIRPEETAQGEQWITARLPRGCYCLIARYYDPTTESALPELRVDGKPRVKSLRVATDTNGFYNRLASRRSFFYALLHYHAYVIVKHQRWLPSKFVERVYLPVGNPETRFQYGALGVSDELELDFSQQLFETHDVYITFYDVASFPIGWQRITSTRCHWNPFGQRCTYLIRLHRRSTAARHAAAIDLHAVS